MRSERMETMTTLDNMNILTSIDHLQRLCSARDACDGCPLLLDIEDGTIWKTHRECAVEGRAPEDWRLQELMLKLLQEDAKC